MANGGAIIRVGILERRREIGGCFHGIYLTPSGQAVSGAFTFSGAAGRLILRTPSGDWPLPAGECRCRPQGTATFSLSDVAIGVNFHWQRQEVQTFQGALTLLMMEDGSLTAVNEIDIEEYLASVIASEMSAKAPLEFLKAHAVMSRSWLMAMLARKGAPMGGGGVGSSHRPDGGGGRPDAREKDPFRAAREGERPQTLTEAATGIAGGKEDGAARADVPEEIIRWYDREDHDRFDVCADDHCQRYQGLTKIISEEVRRAIDATRGVVMLYRDRICDARYHKACGGRTEDFANVWDDVPVPYLTSIADGPIDFPPITREGEAAAWIREVPPVYCHTDDLAALRRVLPGFDQETRDFFRWKVSYDRPDLESLLMKKSGIDFGELHALTPLARGPSGRIIRLRIEGSRRTVIVGKELEIRRWLSPSHLYSSAFVVRTERDVRGKVERFILQGAGWGHGVGLCQIGAAMMALRGFGMEAILGHYFPGTILRRI